MSDDAEAQEAAPTTIGGAPGAEGQAAPGGGVGAEGAAAEAGSAARGPAAAPEQRVQPLADVLCEAEMPTLAPSPVARAKLHAAAAEVQPLVARTPASAAAPTPSGPGGHSAAGSHAAAVTRLMSVYGKSATGFGNDFATEGVDQSNLQYGEITYAGMEALYPALQLSPGDVFYDLGSGIGKLVLYVALRCQASRAVGLEVGERRHALAEAAAGRLVAELGDAAKSFGGNYGSVELLRADISRQRYHDASVVVLTNLCMDQGVQNRTIDSLLKCPSLRRIISITPLPPNLRLKLTRTVRVSCTWAKVSTWQVYDTLPPSGVRNAASYAESAAARKVSPPSQPPRGRRQPSASSLSHSTSEPSLVRKPAQPLPQLQPPALDLRKAPGGGPSAPAPQSKVRERLYRAVRKQPAPAPAPAPGQPLSSPRVEPKRTPRAAAVEA